jgi:cell division protein FtsA
MSRSKIISAIDIGSTKITTIIAQHFPEEDRLNVVGVASEKSSGLRKGQIINIEQATETLTQCVDAAERMAGFQIDSALVAISAPHIESLNSQGVVAVASPGGEIQADDVTRVIEAAQAISLPSSREILHVIPRQFTVDGQEGVIDPVGMTGVRLEVEAHIISASSPAIKNLTKCINEVGINIESLIYSGLATAEAVLTKTERELGVVLADIGGTCTCLTIFNESSPSYCTVLPVGAVNITNDLAIGLRLSLEEAEKIKLKFPKLKKDELKDQKEISLNSAGISGKRKIDLRTAIDGIVKPRVEEIFALIQEELKNSGYGGTTPAGIILTGGGSQTINIKTYCQKNIPLPVRIGTPRETGGLIDDILTPQYTSTIGLLYYHLNQEPNPKGPKGHSPKRKPLPLKGIFHKLTDIIKPLLP